MFREHKDKESRSHSLTLVMLFIIIISTFFFSSSSPKQTVGFTHRLQPLTRPKNSPVPSAGKGKTPPTARAQAAKPTSGQPLEPIREGRQVSSLSIAGVLDQRLFRKSLNPTYLQITCGKPPLFLFLRRKYCSVAVILHPPG